VAEHAGEAVFDGGRWRPGGAGKLARNHSSDRQRQDDAADAAQEDLHRAATGPISTLRRFGQW
jgi:hypothetical protein